MVDPITAGAAVVTGLKLVKQSVDFIKQNISTAQDIGDLIGHIDKIEFFVKELRKHIVRLDID